MDADRSPPAWRLAVITAFICIAILGYALVVCWTGSPLSYYVGPLESCLLVGALGAGVGMISLGLIEQYLAAQVRIVDLWIGMMFAGMAMGGLAAGSAAGRLAFFIAVPAFLRFAADRATPSNVASEVNHRGPFVRALWNLAIVVGCCAFAFAILIAARYSLPWWGWPELQTSRGSAYCAIGSAVCYVLALQFTWANAGRSGKPRRGDAFMLAVAIIVPGWPICFAWLG